MMVIHVEPAAKRTLIVSFPRDLWVEHPRSTGMAKINSAFNGSGGGAERVIKTLEQNFGFNINHYLEVDFQSFEGIVNAIGTVPVYVPHPARDKFTGFIAVNAGCYHLDGYDALQWVRSRHIEFLDPTTGQDGGRRQRRHRTHRASAGLHPPARRHRGAQEPGQPADRERDRRQCREPPEGRRRALEGRHLLVDRRVPDHQPRRHERARLRDVPGPASAPRAGDSRCCSRR